MLGRTSAAASILFALVNPFLNHAQQACNTTLLLDEAQALLRANVDPTQGWTVPSKATAPFLDSTSSLFTAYAYAKFDPDAGMKELLASLAGQWPINGLVPRIRFPAASDGDAWLQGTFFPGPSQWQAPQGESNLTSAGLAAPPYHAIIAMQLFNARRDDAGLAFLAEVFPAIYKYHGYLHLSRDAHNHLVYSYHPWESELPADSPIWAEVLNATQARLTAEEWVPRVPLEEPASIAGYPGEEIFTAEMYLVDLMGRGSGYDDTRIQQETPFLVIDVEFNSVLAAADVSLAAMAKILQLHSSDVVDDGMRNAVTGWADTASTRLEYLWAGDRYSSYLLEANAAPKMASTKIEAATASRVSFVAASTASTAVSQKGVVAGLGVGGLTAQAKGAGSSGRAAGTAATATTTGSGSKRPKVTTPVHHHQGGTLRSLAMPKKPPAVSAPPPSPPSVPLPPGSFYPFSVVSNFWPLYVGGSGLPPSRVEGLFFQIITPGLNSSFDCQGDVYRLPTSACAVNDPKPKVSLLHNLIVQRGLAMNGDFGLNQWLLNETVSLVCAASMDPFAKPPATSPTFRFCRYFDPVSGLPQGKKEDMYGEESTLAAALVWTLLHADAPGGAETPPISHDLTFALVVVELVIAFATGMGCFVLSLSLFRKLSRADVENVGPVSSMLLVREEEEEGHYEGEEGDDDGERSYQGGETEEEEKRSSKALRLGAGSADGKTALTTKQRKKSGHPVGRPRGLYESFRHGHGYGGTSSGTELRRVESEMGSLNERGEGGESGGGMMSSVGRVVGAGLSFLKFW
ncbi:hypothetical protein VYU27_005755 [Nannochloropsis oceanica]